MIWLLLYILAIVAANWLIATFGLISLGPLLVPAGTFAAGLTFGLRDLVQRDLGRRWSIYAIVIGAALTTLISPSLALASGAAFLVSETLDFAVYTRLLARGWPLAVTGSQAVGSVVDTILFLLLAGFFSWPAVWGVVLVKWLAVLPILLVWQWQQRRVAVT